MNKKKNKQPKKKTYTYQEYLETFAPEKAKKEKYTKDYSKEFIKRI